MKTRIIMLAVVVLALGAIAYGSLRLVRATSTATGSELPSTRVKKGSVTIAVAARGELQGGNSEMLSAPMVGGQGQDMAITLLRGAGELVEPGDVVVQFDTTQQEFNQREAEADLAEAEQQVIQAQAMSEATDEESAYAVISTNAEVKLAELEMRKNPTLPAIQRRQNEIALEAAHNKARQAEKDFNNRKTTSAAGIAIQTAALNKARVMAETARKMIESMTLKAKSAGYVNIAQNTNMNGPMFRGMSVPPFQLGDTARGGMMVAQIPDMKNWEVSANVGELDRGHLSPGQKVRVAVVALAGRSFAGHVKTLGGTTGPPWDRRFESRIALDEAGPELRPGMTSNMLITVETMQDALWVPSQALFESDGRTFVYRKGPTGFMPHDVTLIRRSESQAVLKGINEGDVVAMSNPDQQNKTAGSGQQSAMKALSK
jgi:HlyD family secretion protein